MRPSTPLEPVQHSATSAEGSEPGPQTGLDFVTVHYVVLVTESYLRLYTAEGLRQGATLNAHSNPYMPSCCACMSSCGIGVISASPCRPFIASVSVQTWV